MSIVTRSTLPRTAEERYDDWRAAGGFRRPRITRRPLWPHEIAEIEREAANLEHVAGGRNRYQSRHRGHIPDCPQRDQL